MKKNYRFILLIGIVILLIGCNNDKLRQETKNFVVDNSYTVIYDDLKSLISEIQMFPTRDKEEKFIYYLEAIKENHTKFTKDELQSLSDLLSFEYNFNSNKLDYTREDFVNDQQIIHNYIG